MWNCGSTFPNFTWLANSSQVRHEPAAVMPEITPITPATSPSRSRRCGSMAIR